MNTEFAIDINGQKTKIYMQIGFFNHEDMYYPLHKHIFAEMHIFLSGTAVLKCDKDNIFVKAGDVLVIPANMLHQYDPVEKDSKRITFLIDNNCEIFRRTVVPRELLSLLCDEIKDYVLTGKCCKLRALLSYICSDFLVAETNQKAIPITNRKLIIEEFFSKKYSLNVSIDDLSKELKLSHRQTAREVKKITGNTFSDELLKRKIDAAIILSQTTNLPLTKISEMVGYASYSGFYKAYKRMLNELPDLFI